MTIYIIERVTDNADNFDYEVDYGTGYFTDKGEAETWAKTETEKINSVGYADYCQSIDRYNAAGLAKRDEAVAVKAVLEAQGLTVPSIVISWVDRVTTQSKKMSYGDWISTNGVRFDVEEMKPHE
jgi:hypothetical protein